jgi:hypothetical protein
MDTATEKSWSGTFELKLLETSLIALFLEALIDPFINMDLYVTLITSQSRQNAHDQDQDFHIRSSQVQRLISIPRFLHEPLRYMDEIKTTYQELRDDHPRIQRHLKGLKKQEPLSPDIHSRPNRSHRLQVTDAILLTAAIALNSILRAMYPDDSVLLLEASTLANELITLAKMASHHRPLGASYIPPCLVAVVSHVSASTISYVLEITDHLSSGRRRVLWKPNRMRLSCCSRNINRTMLA